MLDRLAPTERRCRRRRPVGPRRIVRGECRKAQQDDDQSHTSHGLPQFGRIRMPAYHRIVRGEQVRFWAWIVRQALLGLVVAPGVAYSQAITDGDTLKLNGVAYRLWGIDAPETKQDCPDGWAAGRLAATHLQSLISGSIVVCERKDTDRYGRTVAICRAGGEDLGAKMVRDGYAWAFLRYSADYADQEALAGGSSSAFIGTIAYLRGIGVLPNADDRDARTDKIEPSGRHLGALSQTGSNVGRSRRNPQRCPDWTSLDFPRGVGTCVGRGSRRGKPEDRERQSGLVTSDATRLAKPTRRGFGTPVRKVSLSEGSRQSDLQSTPSA